MGSNCIDEVDGGNDFDQNPTENECAGGGLVDSGDCQDISSKCKDPLPDSDPLFPSGQTDSAADLSAELSVPYYPSTSGGASPLPSVPPRFRTETENFTESLPKLDGSEQMKRRKTRSFSPVDLMKSIESGRKCLHCEVTKTPQWRAGPMGPKTLCNACGVRFKSGRLFPEYRPAASPTFVRALHSNSHKKVVEMRNKVGVESMGKILNSEDIPSTSF